MKKVIYDDKMENQKEYENRVTRKGFTPSRDRKNEKNKNSWKCMIFLKIFKFHKIHGILWNFIKNQEKCPSVKMTAIP